MDISCEICKSFLKNEDINELILLTNGQALHKKCHELIITKNKEDVEFLILKDNEKWALESNLNKINNQITIESSLFKKIIYFGNNDKISELVELRAEYVKSLSNTNKLIFNFKKEVDDKLKFIKPILNRIYDFWPTYPPDWESRRSKLSISSETKCESCQKSNKILDLHHVIPLGKGGNNKFNNLILLCRNCHEKFHKTNFRINENFVKSVSSKYAKIIGEIVSSINSGKDLTITYIDFEKQKTNRKIRPILITNDLESIGRKNMPNYYLLAFCYLRKEKRVFKINRIDKIYQHN